MLLLIVALAGIAVFALAIFLIQLAPAPPEAIRRLEEMGAADDPLRDAYKRRVRQERSERLKEILAEIGGRMETRQDRLAGIRKRMVQAGYTSPGAGPLFLGLRLVLSLGLALLILLAVTPVLGLSPGLAIFLLNRSYIMELFTNDVGKFMLVAAVFFQVCGFLWIRKIVNIEI